MTSMSTVPPLTMSQTKDELLRHLNMSPETYALMAVSFLFISNTHQFTTRLQLYVVYVLTLLHDAERDEPSLQMVDKGPGSLEEELQEATSL